MIDTKTATELTERFRQAGGFRPFLLVLLVLAHGEGGTWEPPSKAALKRSLRRPNDDGLIGKKDLDATVRHAVSMGLLSAGSTPGRLLLAGSEAQAEAEEVAA